jgi:excisionase family DNA binding protein
LSPPEQPFSSLAWRSLYARTLRRMMLRVVDLKFGCRGADTTSVMNDAMATITSLNVDTNAQSNSEILTVQEVARFLRVPKSTVYKLARLGQLPASKIGKHWRFLRRDIHDWMHTRGSNG